MTFLPASCIFDTDLPLLLLALFGTHKTQTNMTTAIQQNLNAKLTAIFSNGRGEAGLEVGSDPGLSPNDYVRIPNRMVKKWAARLVDPKDAGDAGINDFTKHAKWSGDCGRMEGKDGWVTKGKICVWKGNLYIQDHDYTGPTESEDEMYDYSLIDEFHVESFTYEDILAFVTVNVGHIRDDEFTDAQKVWIHACRFWAVTAGFVATEQSKEYILVDNPSSIDPFAEENLATIGDYSANGWTAAAARATSWRKSNHATGGDIVQGFPRRWLQKMVYMPDLAGASRGDYTTAMRRITSAFYVATHAASPHAVLSLMASSDEAHWSIILPEYGLIQSWDVSESARIRMTPKTQVAGAAMVTDGVVVLRMLVKEALAPMLNNQDQIPALMASYKQVEAHGIRVATYAKWFLRDHPGLVKAVDFNQKDESHAALIGELGLVATKYYEGTTIGKSGALDNAAKQYGEETERQIWSSLARQKSGASAATIAQAYGRIKGASGQASLSGLVSSDEVEVRSSVAAYNLANKRIAAIAEAGTVIEIREDVVVSNMDTV